MNVSVHISLSLSRLSIYLLAMSLMTSITSCRDTPVGVPAEAPIEYVDTLSSLAQVDAEEEIPVRWQEITEGPGVVLDIRYAGTNNFTGDQIYPCGRCFLHPQVAARIDQLQKDISIRYGMKLKIYDCYRPRPAQQRLWDVVPDARYVTPPSKGSMHNRGLAIDLTLIGADGVELDMGTPYDYFGKEAHMDYTGHSTEVVNNRQILRKMMGLHGMTGIRTEWWHFSLKSIKASFDDWEWPCDGQNDQSAM